MGTHALHVNDRLTYLYIADDELDEALSNYDVTTLEEKILFVFGLKDDMYFDAVWAQKGFGPIAYKVAMTISPSGYLAPYWDASRVTKSAQKVWKEFFDGKGSADVEKKLVGTDESNYRNYWYSLKKPLALNKNIAADKKFVGSDPYGERRDQLNDLADSLLVNAMRAIY